MDDFKRKYNILKEKLKRREKGLPNGGGSGRRRCTMVVAPPTSSCEPVGGLRLVGEGKYGDERE
jgi:hypothetical protein